MAGVFNCGLQENAILVLTLLYLQKNPNSSFSSYVFDSFYKLYEANIHLVDELNAIKESKNNEY